MNREAFIAHLNLHGWIAAITASSLLEPNTMYFFAAIGYPLLQSKGIGAVINATADAQPIEEDIYQEWAAPRYFREWCTVPETHLAELAAYLGVDYDP